MGIDERLESVFQGVFGTEPGALQETDSPDSIESWDSANHLALVLALEAEFDVQFDVDEIAELVTVAAIRTRLQSG